MELIKKLLTPSPEKLLKPLYKLADQIDALEPAYEKLTDDQLRGKTEEFKQRVQKGEKLDDLLVEAFAVVREGSKRVLGMRPFKVQMIGGIVLHQGRIAEMKTGEGKTLTAAMPAYLNALEGKGVHIVTVNDYLAQFQGEEMGKLYRFLGLSVGKDFQVDKKDGAIVITYSIKNEGTEPRRVAPWEITRVSNGDGQIGFEAPIDSIWPAGLMTFEQKSGVAWYKTDEAPQNRKVNANGTGWLSYTANGLTLTKKFQDLKPGEAAPGEAEIQIYVNRGKTYIELESQGAYTLLQPGEQLHWPVRWYLTQVK